MAIQACIKNSRSWGSRCSASRGNLKKLRIKIGDPVNEPAPFAVDRSRRRPVLGKVMFPFPAVFRNFGNTILALFEIIPKRIDIIGLRILAGNPDNGNIQRFSFRFLTALIPGRGKDAFSSRFG